MTDHPPTRTNGPDCQVPDVYGNPICVRTFEQKPCDTCPQWPRVTETAEPANPLAAELRQILANVCGDPHNGVAIERLRRLLEHVEQVATEPAELEAIPAGLEPEQEIHARALDAAARVLAPALAEVEPDQDAIAAVWLALAGSGAAFIRDGSRPA